MYRSQKNISRQAVNQKILILTLIAYGTLYAPLTRFSQMINEDHEVLLYGLEHGPDESNRNTLINKIIKRGLGESHPGPLTLEIEDPTSHSGFEKATCEMQDFLDNLVANLKPFESPAVTIKNCDPRKISWLGINLYNASAHPFISHETPHFLNYTFGDLFTELEQGISTIADCAETINEKQNSKLFQIITERIKTAKEDYAELQHHVKDCKASCSDSLAQKALSLFVKEAKPQQKINGINLMQLACTNQHSSEQLTACKAMQKKIMREVSPSYHTCQGSRGIIGETLLKLTAPILEIPAFARALFGSKKKTAYFVGDLHRQNIKGLLFSAGYTQKYKEPESLDAFLNEDEEQFSIQDLEHLA